jgi:hypothetical protein
MTKRRAERLTGYEVREERIWRALAFAILRTWSSSRKWSSPAFSSEDWRSARPREERDAVVAFLRHCDQQQNFAELVLREQATEP